MAAPAEALENPQVLERIGFMGRETSMPAGHEAGSHAILRHRSKMGHDVAVSPQVFGRALSPPSTAGLR
jgi:hypothetical protein